jgi:hypothetical protein
MRLGLVTRIVILEQELLRAESLIEDQTWRGWPSPVLEDALDLSGALPALLYLGEVVYLGSSFRGIWSLTLDIRHGWQMVCHLD